MRREVHSENRTEESKDSKRIPSPNALFTNTYGHVIRNREPAAPSQFSFMHIITGLKIESKSSTSSPYIELGKV